ncbi:MAG: M1 family peptidase [Acidobacteria bacterium]|nr:MAG: M1 family peptidase [Acidobacteriota bacterium]MCE7957612.1 M1 family peptidase [Acidobacteria bacterium ACB2]
MKTRFAGPVLAALCLLPFPARSLDEPRKVVDYDIRVRLDPEKRAFTGTETLLWTNPSQDTVQELLFHLYWNAFRNNRSTFFRESGGQLRGDRADEERGWGFIDVTSMTWDGQDLRPGFRFVSPDDGNPDDRTVLSVSLPRPVGPGETVRLEIGWEAKAPRVFARAGYVRDFYMVGQWYPKIGVYEPAGRRGRAAGGWNCHQYHANSEFYADFGDYRVEIDVPERFVVGSAGALVAERKEGGRKLLRYEQKGIHDFAWTADPRYVVKEDTFEPSRDVPKEELARAARLLGRSEADLTAGMKPVKLLFYMQPDHVDQWTRYADAQKWALAWFGLFAFPYPYAQVSCVDPPEDGIGAGGMEYQTLYTAGTWKGLAKWPLRGIRTQEMVVVHEFGHGYWMGLVASNEFEESWMDEGINSFTEYEMMTRRYRYFLELPFGAGFSPLDLPARGFIPSSPDYDPILAASWKYWGGGSYAKNSYARAGLAVEQVRRLVGEERFWKGFRAYAERWRYDHPTSRDFFDAIALHAPSPWLADLVARTWYGTGFVDYRVLRAASTKVPERTGYDDARKAVNFTEEGTSTKGDAAAKEKGKADGRKDRGKGPWDTVVVVGRDGDVVLPVDVVLTFENGKTWRTTWDGRSKWLRLKTTYGSKLARVDVDPEQRVVLDRDSMNNSRFLPAHDGPSAAAKVRTYGVHLVQILLSTLWTLV